MSSSQQQASNSNNNRSQIPPGVQYADYVDDSSLHPINNANSYPQPSHTLAGEHTDPKSQDYSYDDDDIQNEIDAEIEAIDMQAEQNNYNYEDESIFSDAVQNAFANYEKEYSKHWTHNESNWNSLPDDEDEEILEQMRECILFMSEEYSRSVMPSNLMERTQESTLNPDAVEFLPSWASSSASAEDKPIAIGSQIPHQTKKQDQQEQ